jgi:hypothetical protein
VFWGREIRLLDYIKGVIKSIRISKESAIYSSGASRGLKFSHPKKAFLNWPPYGISSGGKWAPRRRGLSFFLGIIFYG